MSTRRPRPPAAPSGHAHLAALALGAAKFLVREAVQVRVTAAEEPVAGPADGTLSRGVSGKVHARRGPGTSSTPCAPALTTHDREPSRSRTQSAFSWHGLGDPSGQERCPRRWQPDAWSPTKPGWQGPHWKEPCAQAPSVSGSPTRGLPAPPHRPCLPHPGVDAHGVGDAVVLPGFTLVNIRANLGDNTRFTPASSRPAFPP